jgi:hypothetical protein
MSAPTVSAHIDIDASPETVYAIITNLATFAEVTEETGTMVWRKGGSAAVGAVFRGRNRNGFRRWSTTCTVTDAMPGERFGFDVKSGPIPVAHWRYEIVPSDGGARCQVTESTWDHRPGWFRGPAGIATGSPDRTGANRVHIEATLRRLKERAEAVKVG